MWKMPNELWKKLLSSITWCCRCQSLLCEEFVGCATLAPLMPSVWKHWCEFLVTYNVWHVVCGLRKPDPVRCRSILNKFWERYRVVYPNHSIWSEIEEHGVDLGQCCPVLLHGGRGARQKEAAVLGYGISFFHWFWNPGCQWCSHSQSLQSNEAELPWGFYCASNADLCLAQDDERWCGSTGHLSIHHFG